MDQNILVIIVAMQVISDHVQRIYLKWNMKIRILLKKV